MTTRALLLLKKAVQCRLLANRISSPPIAARILDLADEYQALALEEEQAEAKLHKVKSTMH